MARIIIVAMLVMAAVLGGVLYYQQVYAYYEDVVAGPDAIMLTSVSTGAAEPLLIQNFAGIDAISSPLRYRACFETPISQATLTETFVIVENAEPRVAPRWFDCFDAVEIGTALERGEALAFLSQENIHTDVDRVVAVFPDGRAFAWTQLNPAAKDK